MSFAKFFRTPFLQNTSGRLLLAHACKCFVKYSFYIHIPQYVTYKHKTFFSCFEVCYIYPLWQPLQITSCITLTVLQSKFYFYRNIFSNFFKDIRKPYNCLLKNSNLSHETVHISLLCGSTMSNALSFCFLSILL